MKRRKQPFTLSDPENSLYFLVHRLGLAFSSALRAAFSRAGLTEIKPAYLGVLMLLWRESGMDETLGKLGSPGGMKISELGRCLGLEPSTMTGLVDRMERDGLVYRDDDPDDRRSLRVFLSSRGVKIQKDALSAANAAIGDVLSAIEESALEACAQTLQEILKTMEGSAGFNE